MKDEEKKAVAAGPRNGFQPKFEASQLRPNATASLPARHPFNTTGDGRISITNRMPDTYKRVSRCVSYCLKLADAEAWHGLTVVFTTRLTPKERTALAWAVLRSLTPEQVVAVVETVLPDGTSAPIAPFFNHVNEAAFWADMAEPEALEAYCLASFNAMPSSRQAAFLEFVKRGAAA